MCPFWGSAPIAWSVLVISAPHSSIESNSLGASRSEEHTSELQSPCNLVCRLLLEKKKTARLLAQKFESYIEAFPLRGAIPTAFALGDVGPLPIAASEQDISENARRSRSLFENFMP